MLYGKIPAFRFKSGWGSLLEILIFISAGGIMPHFAGRCIVIFHRIQTSFYGMDGNGTTSYLHGLRSSYDSGHGNLFCFLFRMAEQNSDLYFFGSAGADGNPKSNSFFVCPKISCFRLFSVPLHRRFSTTLSDA